MRISRDTVSRFIPLLTALAAAILFFMSIIEERTEGKTEHVAESAGKRVEKRIDILESYIRMTQEASSQHSCLEELPDDMVIYKYENDSLISWSNQFSVLNDNINNRLVFQRLTNLKSRIVSPLLGITDKYSYVNLGPKWYVVKCVENDNNEKTIAGIEVKNTLIDDMRRHENGVNPQLGVPQNFSVLPLNYSGGSPVLVHGEPMFKVHSDSASSSLLSGASLLKWIALLFLSLSVLSFLFIRRTPRVFLFTVFTLTMVAVCAYMWGLNLTENTEIFSPNTYADGPLFFSLGALLLINTFIIMICFCVYMMRDVFMERMQKNKSTRKKNLIIYCVSLLTAALGVMVYVHLTLKSLLHNSNISLEFYRINTDMINSVVIYMSYIGLVFSMFLYVLMTAPAIRELTGRSLNLTSRKSLALFAVGVTAYFSIVTAVNGIHRESERVAVWANRLAVERDLGLEIRLKAIEDEIASDQIISSLAGLDKAEGLILNRISENFLSRIRQNYSFNLILLRDNNPGLAHYYNNLVASGDPLYEGSRFFFVSDGVGHSRYVGMFLYYTQLKGLTRMFLEIEPSSSIEDRGYNSILRQFSAPSGIRRR